MFSYKHILAWTYVAVLRIRDVYLESLSQDQKGIGSRIRIRDKVFLTKKIVIKLLEIWSKMFSLDPGSRFFPSRIPYPGVKKEQDPGSRIRMRTLLGRYQAVEEGY